MLIFNVSEIGKLLKADEVTIGYPNVIDGQTSLNHYGYLPLKQFGYQESNVVTMIKDLSGEEEELFASLKSVCRKNIRRCRKEDVSFEEIQSKNQWLECYNLNLQTLGSIAYSKKAMGIMWDNFVLQGAAMVTALRHKGEITNVVLTTGLRDSYYYWFGFNSRTDVVPGAANLLLWKTMLLYKQKGFKFFEVGSVEFVSGKYGNISRFKESFNGIPMYMLSGTLRLRPIKLSILDLLKSVKR